VYHHHGNANHPQEASETTMISGLESNRNVSRSAMLGLAAILVLSTLFLSYAVPLTPGRMLHPAATLFERVPLWSFLSAHHPAFLANQNVFAFFLLLACAAGFVVCALGVWLAWNAGSRRDLVMIAVGTGMLCTTLTLFAPPNLNSNLWNFIMRARVATAYGQNPYVTAAAEFPNDPLYPYANPKYTGTPGCKLAAWMVFSVIFAKIGAGDPVQTLFAYRTGLLLFAFGTIFLLTAALRKLAPDKVVPGVILWAWNPIVLMNSLARTDTIMLFYLAFAVFLLAKERRRLAVIPLTLSIFVKIIPAPLLAVSTIADARAGRWKEVLFTVLLFTATTIAIWIPFYHHNAWHLITQYGEVAGSAEGSVGGSAKFIASIGFGLLVVLVGVTRKGDVRNLLAGWVLIQIYFSLFFAKFASADYLMSLIFLVAVTLDWRAVLFTFAIGLSYFLFDEWYLVGSENFPLPDLFPFSKSMVFWIPPIAGALALVLWFFWRRSRSPAVQ
jgi:hypothetical protein